MYNEIKKQRYYIYENIDKLKDQNQIINLIKLKDCKFTENGNGIFLNISTLDPDIINIIYQILINTIDYKEENGEHFVTEFYYNDEVESTGGSSQIHQKSDNLFSSDELRMEDYSKKEQEIITYSKKYNL